MSSAKKHGDDMLNGTLIKWCALTAMALLMAACVAIGTGPFRPDLNDDRVDKIARGQDAAAVLAVLGAPYRKMAFERTRTNAWDYLYQDTWGYWVEYSVIFGDDGLVQGWVKRRIEPSDKDK